MRTQSWFAAAAIFVAPLASAGVQNLVANGGFETGTFSGWTVTPAPVGSWIVIFTNPGAGHTGNSFAQFLSFGGIDDRISQNLATTPGASYVLDFWLRTFQDEFRVDWNGTTIFDITPATAPPTWTEFTTTVTATGPSTTLAFRGRGSFFLDDVSVVPAPGGLAGALAFVVLACRRRRGCPHRGSTHPGR
jgi:hypothetical protein